jgi:hypothetical protein
MRSAVRFDCQLYVQANDILSVAMPYLSAPRRVARLEPISFETLTDPALGRLLVALDGLT